jgi:L-threonylcarbamoyladenylate synthase
LQIEKLSPHSLNLAVQILKSGGTVVYPTDTAYGLGANASSLIAVEKVFKLKGRDFNKPIHVVVRDLEMAKQLVEFNLLAEKIFNIFLPGPLTLILGKKPGVLDLLTANLPTLGIRLPNNNVTLELSKLSNLAYTATSANVSSEITPYRVDEISVNCDLILDAGNLPKVSPSTIIDLTTNEPRLLRAGPVSFEEVIAAL